MTLSEDAMGNKFVKSTDELKPEYGVKKVTSLLQFYKLRPPTSKELLAQIKQEAKEEVEKWGKDVISESMAKQLARKRHGLYKDENSTDLSLYNLTPIVDVPYLVYSPQEDIYYFKTFRNYDCEHLYWYRRTLTFSGDDKAVDNFRRYAEDGMLYICFDKALADDIASMLKRLWKANLSGDGQLDYRIFYELLDQYLKYEDYKSYGGYKTLCRQFDERIAELWKQASSINIKTEKK